MKTKKVAIFAAAITVPLVLTGQTAMAKSRGEKPDYVALYENMMEICGKPDSDITCLDALAQQISSHATGFTTAVSAVPPIVDGKNIEDVKSKTIAPVIRECEPLQMPIEDVVMKWNIASACLNVLGHLHSTFSALKDIPTGRPAPVNATLQAESEPYGVVFKLIHGFILSTFLNCAAPNPNAEQQEECATDKMVADLLMYQKSPVARKKTARPKPK